MTRSRIVAIAIAAIVTAAVVLFFVLRPSDEQRVRAQLLRTVAAVTVTEDDTNPIVRLARIRREFKETLDKDVRISLVDVPNVPALRNGRDALGETATQLTAVFRTMEIDLSAIEVKLDDAHTSAQVKSRATLVANGRDGRARRESRAVDFLLYKIDGTWRITTINVWPKDRE